MDNNPTTFIYDVVIVGGGPSGVACGIQLQKSGINNCIIDKAVFPRKKLCGGLITEKTYNLLSDLCDHNEAVFSPAIRQNACSVAIYSENTKLATATPKTNIRIADRECLDNCLLDFYKSLGGKVFEDKKVSALMLSESAVLTSDGDRFCFNYLIAADGVNSIIRAKTGKKIDSLGLCLETEVMTSPSFIKQGEIQIHFGVIKNGYSWVFPNGNSYKIGFGNTYKKHNPYKEQFIAYLNMLGISDESTCRIEGSFIPYGGCMTNPTFNDNVFFVGDAAGMVDPLYGEGLYYAYVTGCSAADSISHYSDNAAKHYAKSTEKVVRQIRSCVYIKRFFFSPFIQKQFKKHIKGRNRFLSFYVDFQISRYSYDFVHFYKLFVDYKTKYKKEYMDCL